MHMTITKKVGTFAHLIFIMAGQKGQLIPMENGKWLSIYLMNIMQKDMLKDMKNTLKLKEWSSACKIFFIYFKHS